MLKRSMELLHLSRIFGGVINEYMTGRAENPPEVDLHDFVQCILFFASMKGEYLPIRYKTD